MILQGATNDERRIQKLPSFATCRSYRVSSLVFARLAIGFVGGGVHQFVDLGRVAHGDANEPRFIGSAVERFWGHRWPNR